MILPAVRFSLLNSRQRAVSSTLLLVTVALMTLAPSAIADDKKDDNKVVRVCIPYHSGNDALLNQLAITLDNHKPDKTTHTKVEAVQLGGVSNIVEKERLADETRDRASQSHCDYVLVLYNPDLGTARSYQPNVMYPEQQVTTSTRDPYMRKQDREIYVVIKYRLYRNDSVSAATDGFVSTHSAAPQNAVVADALDMLAKQVFTKVTK